VRDERVSGAETAHSAGGLLTAAEAAEVMRCHEKTVRRMIRRGELPAVFFAGRYLIAPDDLPTAPRLRLAPPPPRRSAPRGVVSAAFREIDEAA
jgi:excisionase family DNA binding protein